MNRVLPIALFAYARPEHLLKCINHLRKNEVKLIYAFSDGPRTPDKAPLVEEVRHILHAVDWCEIHISERQENLGLGTSIRSGVSEILKQHDRLMVVEDDIILRPGAYEYTAAALEHYQNTPEVMTISMWCHPSLVPRGASGGFFSRRFICWGWATYRWAWEKYQGTPMEVYQQCSQANLDVLAWGIDLQWQAEHASEKNLWYVGYALTHFLQNGISYFSGESLTANIGFDGSGENTGSARKHENNPLADKPLPIPETWPKVNITSGLERQFAAYFEPKKKSFMRSFRNYLGKQRRMIVKRFKDF